MAVTASWAVRVQTSSQERSQSAETMLTVRAPQSKPARIALSILSASINAIVFDATADGLGVSDGVV